MKTSSWRKKYNEQKVLQRDKDVFRGLSKTHYMTKEQLKALGFSEKSFLRYARTEVIEKVEYVDKQSNVQEIYRLTDYGRDFIQRDVFQEKMTFYSSRGEEHDLRIAQVYTDLVSQGIIKPDEFYSERDIWKEHYRQIDEARATGNEERARELETMREQGLISAPDFYYKTIDGDIAICEVITQSGSYTDEHLAAKQEFSNSLGLGQVQHIRI